MPDRDPPKIVANTDSDAALHSGRIFMKLLRELARDGFTEEDLPEMRRQNFTVIEGDK